MDNTIATIPSNETLKCVMVIDQNLSLGLKVNTAGVLAMSIGKKDASIIGPDIVDGSGETHMIINIPLPILSTDADVINGIREKALKLGSLFVVDFTETAHREVYYEDYTEKLAVTPSEDLKYLGVALYGPKKLVNKLVGNLPLLR